MSLPWTHIALLPLVGAVSPARHSSRRWSQVRWVALSPSTKNSNLSACATASVTRSHSSAARFTRASAHCSPPPPETRALTSHSWASSAARRARSRSPRASRRLASVVLYGATELHHKQAFPIETAPGAVSAWFAIVVAVGLLPTHISAIIGVLEAEHKSSIMVWLLAIYGGVGAVYPLLIVANHIGTGATRWPLSFLYPFVWVILLISFGALSLAGVIGAYRAKQDGRVFGELSPSRELRR
jgi:hypothetical protein